MDNDEKTVTIINYRRSACNNQPSGLERQRISALDWAAQNGVEFDEEIEEISGGLKMAPQLTRIMERCEGGETIEIVVQDPSRIARGMSVLGKFLARASKCGLNVRYVRDNGAFTPNMVQLALAIDQALQIQRAFRRERKHG